MKLIRKFNDPESGGEKSVRFETPDECPICHKRIEPVYLYGNVDTESNASVFYYCRGCDNSFVSRYKDLRLFNTTNRTFECTYHRSEPVKFEERIFTDDIIEISPNFSKIYNQALQAEQYSLNEIAGIGYRKALEFLIKDFCILLHPEEEDSIKGKFLNNCIQDYLDKYEPLRDVSTVAVWIGNDETHYVRTHTGKDINDLKKYLDSVVLYVQLEANTGSAKDIIQKRRSQKNH